MLSGLFCHVISSDKVIRSNYYFSWHPLSRHLFRDDTKDSSWAALFVDIILLIKISCLSKKNVKEAYPPLNHWFCFVVATGTKIKSQLATECGLHLIIPTSKSKIIKLVWPDLDNPTMMIFLEHNKCKKKTFVKTQNNREVWMSLLSYWNSDCDSVRENLDQCELHCWYYMFFIFPLNCKMHFNKILFQRTRR